MCVCVLRCLFSPELKHGDDVLYSTDVIIGQEDIFAKLLCLLFSYSGAKLMVPDYICLYEKTHKECFAQADR